MASVMLLAVSAASAQIPDPDDFVEAPEAGNWTAWREHIMPRGSETAWRSIDWLPGFADGMRAAREQRRPLLLWAMNGHPLGCT